MGFALLSLLLATASFVLILLQITVIPAEQRRKLLLRVILVFLVFGISVVTLLWMLARDFTSEVVNAPAPMPIPREQIPRENSLDIPAFEFPPPQASASADIDLKSFILFKRGDQKLEGLATHLSSALYEAGYTELSWYSVPHGFALVSRLEQFNEDGTPAYGEYRWVDEVIAPTEIRNIWDYILALFYAKPGHYRIFVFIVTDFQYTQSEKTPPTRDEAVAWLRKGMQNGLPPEISRINLTHDYTCKAFIYEFVRPQEENNPPTSAKSKLTGVQHLQKSKIWEALRRP